MDRNDLLALTRAAFLQAFHDAQSKMLRGAFDHLFSKAEVARSSQESRQLMDARVVLSGHEAALQQHLCSTMEQLINRSFQTAYSTFRPSFSSVGGLSGLSLIDTQAVDDELRIEAFTRLLRDEAEEPLRDLNIRIALLFEQDNIKERENPFRPYLFSRCIVTAVEQLKQAEDVASRLIDQLVEELRSEIAGIYEVLNALLARHGIAAELMLKIRKFPHHAASSILPAADMGASGDVQPLLPQAAAAMPAYAVSALAPAASQEDALLKWVQQASAQDLLGADAVMVARDGEEGMALLPASQPRDAVAPRSDKPGWLAGAPIVGNVLRRLFSGGGAAVGAAEAAASGPEGLPTATVSAPLAGSLASLQQAVLDDGEPWVDDSGAVRNLVMEQRSALREASDDVNQQMIIDVVAMLFEFILRDSQVPAEVRAQLGRLQILVLKTALQDPALFTQKHHPARLLVNRIGSISLGLQQVDPSGERMTAEICRIVEALLADEREGLAPFERMLDELDAFIASELLARDERVGRAVTAMSHAESRTLRFARITAMLAEALSGLTIDDQLHGFLVNSWARAIEFAERDDAVRARRYRLLVPDLIWSIVPKVAEQDRKQLVVLLLPMLTGLREGLARIGWSEAQQKPLMDWLVESHQHALHITQVAGIVPSLADIHARFARFVDGDAEEDAPQAVVEVDPKLLDEALGELEGELEVIDRKFQALLDEPPAVAASPAALAAGEAPPERDDEVLARLKSGIAIELNLDGNPNIARLHWVSQNASNLVLSVDSQSPPAVVSVRMFQRLLASGRARFLEAAPLFERAIASLLQSADRLDSGAAVLKPG